MTRRIGGHEMSATNRNYGDETVESVEGHRSSIDLAAWRPGSQRDPGECNTIEYEIGSS